MRIGVATVLFDDERQRESQELHARIQLMRAILRVADQHRTALLVLPAGFFVVSRKKDREGIVRRAQRSLSGARTAVLWGVDVHVDEGISKAGRRARDPVLPFYLYLRDASGALLLKDVRQLAYCSTQAVSATRLPSDRVVSVAGRSIGVLACGELLAKVYGRSRAMDYVRDIVSNASIVVDAAHADLKVRGLVRWTRAIERCSTSHPSCVVVAQHLCRQKMHLEAYADDGAPPKVASRAATRAHRHRETDPRFTLDVYEL